MHKKIFYFLLLGLFLTGCSQTVNNSANELVSPTVSAIETATQQPSTSTPVPSATITTTPAPDFSVIGLPSEQNSEVAFDFVEQMCAAEWFTRGLQLPCPGNKTLSSAGYVTQLDAEFQGLPSNINILLVYTPQSKYETISSKYPAFTVKKGDRFRAVLSCREHSFCDVDFLLSFYLDGGPAGLTHWKYIFTDSPLVIDYSLDAIAGKTVQFNLGVNTGANVSEAYAVWIAPHIYRATP